MAWHHSPFRIYTRARVGQKGWLYDGVGIGHYLQSSRTFEIH